MRNSLNVWRYPSATTHANACLAWEKGAKFRGAHRAGDRKLVDGQMDKWMSKLPNGDIAMVRSGRPVVTHHVNGDCTIEPWSSTSTWDEFANAFTPLGVDVCFKGSAAPYLSIDCLAGHDRRYWRLPKAVRLVKREHGWDVPVLEPWPVPVLDKGTTKAALEASGFNAFMTWARPVVALGGWHKRWIGHDDAWDDATIRLGEPQTLKGRGNIMRALKDTEQWMNLLTAPTLTSHANTGEDALDKLNTSLRHVVYLESMCVRITDEPYLDGDKALNRYVEMSRKYRTRHR